MMCMYTVPKMWGIAVHFGSDKPNVCVECHVVQ